MLIKRRDAAWQGKAILYRSNNHPARVTVLFPVNASAQSANHFQSICTLPVPLQTPSPRPGSTVPSRLKYNDL